MFFSGERAQSLGEKDLFTLKTNKMGKTNMRNKAADVSRVFFYTIIKLCSLEKSLLLAF